MTNSFDENLTISPAFIQRIRDFLEHLYDFPDQQKQTLVLSLAETAFPAFEIAGLKVRKLLLDALEKIGEEKSLAFRSSQARCDNLLRLPSAWPSRLALRAWADPYLKNSPTHPLACTRRTWAGALPTRPARTSLPRSWCRCRPACAPA